MKTRAVALVTLFAFLMISGCRSAFQPPPASFERWTKSGAPRQQVMTALLECGYPSPHPDIKDWINSEGETWEASKILAQRCMEGLGFTEKYGDGSKSECRYYSYKDTRKYSTSEQIKALEHACDPNTPPPKPSVEKRLNSPYCKVKEYSKYPQCQPVVVPSSQTENKVSRPVVVPYYPAIDRVTPQVQKDSNAQMNQLLEDTNNRK